MSMRAALIRGITFLGGLYFFLKFVLPEQTGFANYHEQISDGFVLVGAMALALGLINLLMVHGGKVVYRRKGWGPSVALLTGLVSMITITSLDWRATREISASVQRIIVLKEFADRIADDHAKGIVPAVNGKELPAERRYELLVGALQPLLGELQRERAAIGQQMTDVSAPAVQISWQRFDRELSSALDEAARLAGEHLVSAGIVNSGHLQNISRTLGAISVASRGLETVAYGQSTVKRLYDFLFEGLFIALGAAMFSLLGFYIAAAAYRAFRVRSVESVLMMTAALFVMLGQIPFGLWISDALPEVRLWLLQVPSAAAARAIDMGASLAGLVMAFRMWLSIESESFK